MRAQAPKAQSEEAAPGGGGDAPPAPAAGRPSPSRSSELLPKGSSAVWAEVTLRTSEVDGCPSGQVLATNSAWTSRCTGQFWAPGNATWTRGQHVSWPGWPVPLPLLVRSRGQAPCPGQLPNPGVLMTCPAAMVSSAGRPALP